MSVFMFYCDCITLIGFRLARFSEIMIATSLNLLLFSFFLGHVPDISHLMKESGNDELPLTVVLQQWYVNG